MCVELENFVIIYLGMFPYNDEENAWISGNDNLKTKLPTRSFFYSFLCAILAALFSTTIPPLMYFSRVNLF
tara:strand:- start:321 stop:533 length:213 start_codon:yes stop_codon:yes gene_type:complete